MSTILCSNRRDFLRAVIGGAAGMSFAYRAYGQAAPQPVTATKLSADLAVLAGDGGNVAVVIGPDGLMMIDGGLPNRVADLQKAIAEVDAHKVRVLFNTHWHFDHTGSNETLGASGAKIIAHENTKKWLSQKVTMEALNRTFEPLKAEGLPAEVFAKDGKMSFGKEKIEYVHVAPAHTDSDAYVFLPGPNVLHTGDLLFNGFYPVIDYSTGGWIGGMVAASDAMLNVGDNKTRVIPGHGPLGTKDELKATSDMLHTVHERLETLSKQGKSVDEVLASKPTKDLDEKWGKGFMNPDTFVKVAYTSLSRHNQKA